VFLVLLQVIEEDEEIIEVDYEEFVEEVSEGVVHIVLERSRSVA